MLPIRYQISLRPDAETRRSAGTETVALQFQSPADRIQFNTRDLALSDVSFDGQPVASVNSDPASELTTVRLATTAAAGNHLLRLQFSGHIGERPEGMFRQAYVDVDGEQQVMLSTQLESVFARQLFPCWDEPAFRASFELSVTAPARWVAISNMPVAERRTEGALATTRFLPSPPMSSYLVELTLGDLADVSGSVDGVELGVWAVRGQQAQGQYALENARQILGDYNEYFGLPYPLPKLDSLAIPGGFNGGMENWGAITYNDGLLLLSPQGALAERQRIYSIQAHEMAHLWFGDLVTMAWWDDIWLNESFASWMAARQTDRRHADWHWWLRQDRQKQAAMTADALAASRAVQLPVADDRLADSSFDQRISYNKGQAILRMLEAWLGADVFRAGMQRYVKDHAYSNATSGDLWLALGAAAGKDVHAFAAGWTERPGFPLVSASAHCDARGARTVRLTQQRYLADGAPGQRSQWQIPLSVRSGTATAPRSVLFTDQPGDIAAGRCGEPLTLNADAIGYFRVRYDAATLAQNTRAIGQLPAGDRLALLDDQWSLANAGRAPLSDYLSLAESLGTQIDAPAWTQITAALETLEFVERGSPGHARVVEYARGLLKPVLVALGLRPQPGESPDVVQLREQLLTDLGIWGDTEVIADARQRFARFLKDRASVSPDEQAAMLAVVAFHADADTFAQLLQVARSAQGATEINRYYGALADVADPQLAARVAALVTHRDLPPQANALPLRLVFGLADHHPTLAWQTFGAHTEQLLEPISMLRAIYIGEVIPRAFWAGVPLAELESFARSHLDAGARPQIERGLQSIRVLQRSRTLLVRDADAYLAARRKSGSSQDASRATSHSASATS